MKIFLSHKLFPPILFALIIALLWHPVLSVGFLSDDFEFLRLAQIDRDWSSYFFTNIIGTQEGNSYGPMWNILFRAQYEVFGLNAVGFHTLILVFYWLSAWVLYALILALSKRKDIALLAAILFSIFPGHTEAVAWVAVQVHVFASLCFFSALLCYTRFLQTRQWKYYLASIVTIALSLWTKEIGITFLAVFALLELYLGQCSLNIRAGIRFLFGVARRFFPFVLLMGMYLALRHHATGQLDSYYGGEIEINLWQWMMQLLDLTLAIVLPVSLRVAIWTWGEAHWLFALFLDSVFIFFLIFVLTQERKLFLWSVASFLVVSLPFLQTHISHIHTEGERYAYLMSFFFALFLAIPLVHVWKYIQQKYFFLKQHNLVCSLILLCSVFLLFIPSTQARIGHWQAAGELTQSFLNSAKELVLDSKDHYVIVALTESVDGAQVMRNAIGEAMKNFSGQEDFSFERMMTYTTLKPAEVDQHLFSVRNIDDTHVRLETEVRNRLFSGVPEHVGDYVTVSLDNFGHGTDYRGDAIDLRIHEDAFADFAGERSLKLLYVDGGVMYERILIE